MKKGMPPWPQILAQFEMTTLCGLRVFALSQVCRVDFCLRFCVVISESLKVLGDLTYVVKAIFLYRFACREVYR